MRVLQIVNYHRFGGGLDIAVKHIIKLLTAKGVGVSVLTRDSSLLADNVFSRLKAFAYSLYSPSAVREILDIIKECSPDIVHVHELYPLISPWVLNIFRKRYIPVILTCHDFRLTCPIATHSYFGRFCNKCMIGGVYWCILKNCRKKFFESMAYSLRSAFAQEFQLFQRNVTVFISPSMFVKNWLVSGGFPEDRIIVIPNLIEIPPESEISYSRGDYGGYVGRIVVEKGIRTLLEAAGRHKEISIRVAGDHSAMKGLTNYATDHITFLGALNKVQLKMFYRNMRFLVVPSLCQESFGLVAGEAMAYGRPVIASKLGGLEEVVEDGITGLLFEPGNVEELANKIKYLWDNPDLGKELGMAGREKVIREYSEDVYYEKLMEVYGKAIEISTTIRNTQGKFRFECRKD